jgi:undecaprenyl diphosphate synthase
MENLPRHVAIIPDGNRRWAKRKGMLAWLGHREGEKNSEDVLEIAKEMGIFCLTFWAGSYDNLTKRPAVEVKFLEEVYRASFLKLLKNKDIFKDEVKVSVFGYWRDLLPKRIKEPIEELIEKTKNHSKKFLNFLIGYNGTGEMMEAIERIVREHKKDQVFKITPQIVKENLWTRDLPAVDLVIRTGLEGDPHWSNGFMMWDTADSQFYFTETLWPDFGKKEFQIAIESFKNRERRLGA